MKRLATATVTGVLSATVFAAAAGATPESAGEAADSTAIAAADPSQPTAEMQVVLDAIASFDAPPLAELSPLAARNTPGLPDWVAAAAEALGVPSAPEPVGDIGHVTIPNREGEGLLARVYTPATPGPHPVLVYFHGGGWVIGSIGAYEATARALTNAADTVVVSVAYRQAPEAPFPAAATDAYDAYQWVLDNAADLGGDPDQVAIGGESAGGNLATVASMMARDEGAPMPVHQLLIYPVTNFDFETDSYSEHATAVPLDRASMEYFWGNYLADPAQGADPVASPLRAESLADLPPATIILAEIDPLRSEGEAYAERLATDGVAVTLCLYPGVTHEFFGMAPLIPEAERAQAVAAQGLRGEPIDDAACEV